MLVQHWGEFDADSARAEADRESDERHARARDRELEFGITLEVCKRKIQVTSRLVARSASGVVTLSGTVGSQSEKQRTLDMVARLPGVREVVDQLAIAHRSQEPRFAWRNLLPQAVQRMRPIPALTVGLILVAGLVFSTRGAAKESLPPLYPVQGSVRYEGWIPAGASVVLHSLNTPAHGLQAFGKVREDGTFRLTTRREDGVPVGEYAVTFELRKLIQDQNGVRYSPNLFPDRYTSPGTSPVRVVVLEGRQNDLQTIDIKR